MAYQDEDGAKSKINEAIKFWRLVNDSDSTNRAEALNDIKFAAGDQWGCRRPSGGRNGMAGDDNRWREWGKV